MGSVSKGRASWEQVAELPAPSWYLDPAVAEQKRKAHLELIRKWIPNARAARLLKTDLFEEAYGRDSFLDDLRPHAGALLGVDISSVTVERARRSFGDGCAPFFAADLRRLAIRSESIDVIVSNSSLDHFDTPGEFREALGELVRVLRPGGLLIVTLDNPWNPLYHLLRLTSRVGWTPYPLGHTTTQAGLLRSLRAAGLEVTDTGTLIHNPRVFSTLLFLFLRRLLNERAGAPIGVLLRLWEKLERLPTRRFTACFIAACARKIPRE